MVQDVSLLASIDSNMISIIFHLTIGINLWTSHLQLKLCDRIIDFWLYLADIIWIKFSDGFTDLLILQNLQISTNCPRVQPSNRLILQNLQISTNCPTVQPSNHPTVQLSNNSKYSNRWKFGKVKPKWHKKKLFQQQQSRY